MAIITKHYVVDLANNDVYVQVPAVQYESDNARFIEFEFLNNGQPFNLEASEYTATIMGTKADGKGVQYSCTITSGYVVAQITKQMSAAAGLGKYQIILCKNGDGVQVASFPFYINVTQSAYGEAIASDDDYRLISELVASATEIISQTQEAAETATAAAETAHTDALIAESALESAEMAIDKIDRITQQLPTIEGYVDSARQYAADANEAKTMAGTYSSLAESSANSAQQYATNANTAASSAASYAATAQAAVSSVIDPEEEGSAAYETIQRMTEIQNQTLEYANNAASSATDASSALTNVQAAATTAQTYAINATSAATAAANSATTASEAAAYCEETKTASDAAVAAAESTKKDLEDVEDIKSDVIDAKNFVEGKTNSLSVQVLHLNDDVSELKQNYQYCLTENAEYTFTFGEEQQDMTIIDAIEYVYNNGGGGGGSTTFFTWADLYNCKEQINTDSRYYDTYENPTFDYILDSKKKNNVSVFCTVSDINAFINEVNNGFTTGNYKWNPNEKDSWDPFSYTNIDTLTASSEYGGNYVDVDAALIPLASIQTLCGIYVDNMNAESSSSNPGGDDSGGGSNSGGGGEESHEGQWYCETCYDWHNDGEICPNSTGDTPTDSEATYYCEECGSYYSADQLVNSDPDGNYYCDNGHMLSVVYPEEP